MSAGYSGTETVLAMLIYNPDIIENSEKIPNKIGTGSRPLESTIARSSAHDLLTVRGTNLRSLRSIRVLDNYVALGTGAQDKELRCCNAAVRE